MFGIAPQHKANTTFARAFGDLRNALRQKCVVPQIGVGIERHRREENHHRLLQSVCRLDRHIERGIVERALGTLHPVHHAPAVGNPARRHGEWLHVGRTKVVQRCTLIVTS